VPWLEVQIHPLDIRSGVRALFFTRRQLRLLTAAAAVWLVVVLLALALGPSVLRNLLSRQEYDALAADRTAAGARLKEQVGRLDELGRRGGALRVQMARIHLAYGLPEPQSSGQGGFPFTPAPTPDSIYSDTIRLGNRLESTLREEVRVLDAFLAEVQSFEAAHREQVLTTPSTCPLRGDGFVLTSPFGSRRSPFTKALDFHSGLDLAAAAGTTIYAPADGLVAYAGRYPLSHSVSWWRFGNLVALRHGERFITLFGHCAEVSVRRGQRVRQGDILGTVGSTGWSTSPHLHYEIRRWEEERGFVPVDPRIYILNHRWRDQESLLVRGRRAPDAQGFEPLPPIIGSGGSARSLGRS
jgi:murein DD-endopeptidase MepM/ murein hydrolase activator NlpD